jgi:hypothetical protein
VSGGRTRSNNYNVNGGYSAEQLVNSPSIQPSPDSVSEFRVISHDYEAALGRNSGSILNVITKSGGNDLHGSVYEFLRNDALNAKGYFDREVPKFEQNEFGATLGGALRRDKTFSFLSYEGRRQNRGISSSPVPVPTRAERGGDFSSGPIFSGVIQDGTVAQALSIGRAARQPSPGVAVLRLPPTLPIRRFFRATSFLPNASTRPPPTFCVNSSRSPTRAPACLLQRLVLAFAAIRSHCGLITTSPPSNN